MTGKYYQGEDISILISLYTSKEMIEKINITKYRVDLIVVSSDGTQLYATTDSESETEGVLISNIDDYTLNARFTPSSTSTLSVGNARVEIRLTNTTTGYTTITSNDMIFIENSDIGKI